MAKPNKTANINAFIYDGEFSVLFECVGEDKCKYARFYVDPPSEEDECSTKVHSGCTNALAIRKALENLRDNIVEHLKQFENNEEEF